jgi:peptide/nickel transport system permease protein
MIDLAALSFLGLGVQPPTADWGVMISTGEQSLLAGHPEQSMYAGFMIVLAVCAFTLFGERLIDYDRADAR